jgi:peptide/nickel transport system substrate-binding protein
MIQQALAGLGHLGNDLYAPFDQAYASHLPQRQQDLEQARSLLKAAGREGLTVELQTAPVAAGLVEAAQVFAEQAKGAGVTVKVNKLDSGVFYGDDYLKWDFAQDFWFTRDYLPQTAQGSLPDAPYNETHWADEKWMALIAEARKTTDADRRKEILHEAQEIEYESGGYIIWGFNNQIDAYSDQLTGFEPDRSGIPLTSYTFRQVSFKP